MKWLDKILERRALQKEAEKALKETESTVRYGDGRARDPNPGRGDDYIIEKLPKERKGWFR